MIRVPVSQYSCMLLFGLFETAIFDQRYHYELDLDNAENIDELQSSRLNELKYQKVLNTIIDRAIHRGE